jgi:histidinol-phosphate aminotransferase
MKQLPGNIFRQELQDMAAYKVADATGLIKLDAMENPYQWPTQITNQWLEQIRHCQLNRYPDPDAKKLVATIRRLNQIPNQFDILLGNGSDEIIQILLMALPAKSCVLSPAPGFVMYKQIALSLGLKYHGIPLQAEDYDLDLPAMLEAIHQYQPSCVFLAYPNNPTANLFNRSSIKKILEASPGLVVIDEAYAPFANASFIKNLGDYPNVLVMRTISKLGLAGLRLGFIAGNPIFIEQLNKIRLPYNINILTQVSAEFALSQQDLFAEQTEKICLDRNKIIDQLNSLPGIKTFPSSANFVLFRTPPDKANTIFISLKNQGILIKNLSPQAGLLTDCLRVTIGKPEENTAFIKALKNSLAQ